MGWRHLDVCWRATSTCVGENFVAASNGPPLPVCGGHEVHEGMLRELALTADGSKLATASTKGTVLRVWDVATSTCLQEFRRGVERATITCLCWSWDYQWLSCTSDKGTAHVFFVGDCDQKEEKKSSDSSSSYTKRLFSSVRNTVKGDTKKHSVCQIRGVPHPLACAFVVDSPNVLAVAGWDADGNGVLLVSEFAANQEARRIAYHVLVKSSLPDAQGLAGETEEERRRRRLRGWKPSVPPTPVEGRVFCGDRGDQDNTLEQGMEQIHFDDKGEFVTITTTTHNNSEEKGPAVDKEPSSSNSNSKPVINEDSPDSQRDTIATTITTMTTIGTDDSDKSHISKDIIHTSDEGIGSDAPLSLSLSLQDDHVSTEPLNNNETTHPNGSRTATGTTLQEQQLEAEATSQ